MNKGRVWGVREDRRPFERYMTTVEVDGYMTFPSCI